MADDMENRISALESGYREINAAIYGTGILHPGVEGVLTNHGHEIGRLANRLEAAEDTLAKYRYIVLGWTAAGSVFGGVIVALIVSLIGVDTGLPIP